jgi:hypothetical protein
MTTTAAAENLAGRPVAEKKDEKVEKRKALGRGLASLLPGPRVVGASTEYASTEYRSGALPYTGGGDASETQVPRFARDDKTELPASAGWRQRGQECAAPHEQLSHEPSEVISIQAQAIRNTIWWRIWRSS